MIPDAPRLLAHEGQLLLEDSAHHRESSARAVGLVARLAVRRAGVEAEAAVDAAHQPVFDLFRVHAPLWYRVHGRRWGRGLHMLKPGVIISPARGAPPGSRKGQKPAFFGRLKCDLSCLPEREPRATAAWRFVIYAQAPSRPAESGTSEIAGPRPAGRVSLPRARRARSGSDVLPPTPPISSSLRRSSPSPANTASQAGRSSKRGFCRGPFPARRRSRKP